MSLLTSRNGCLLELGRNLFVEPRVSRRCSGAELAWSWFVKSFESLGVGIEGVNQTYISLAFLRLLASAKVEGEDWYATIFLAGEVGLRVGEVKALRWREDVDMIAERSR